MKRFKDVLSKPWATYAFAGCISVLFFMILSNLGAIKSGLGVVWNLFLPIVIGIVTAYLVNPISMFYEKNLFKKTKKESTRHILGVVMTIVCLVLVLAVLLVALIPSLAQSIAKLIKNWDVYTDKLNGLLKVVGDFAAKHHINIDLSKIENVIDNSMEKIVEFFKGNYKSILNVIGNIGSGFVTVAVGIIFGFCFLISKKSILRFLGTIRRAFIPEEKINRADALYIRCHKIFLKYVGSTLLDALIITICTLIFMLIMKMPYAPLVAVVCGLTNIIPTFGPIIGAAVGIFFLILEIPWQALFFLFFICSLQTVDGLVIKPKLFSGSLGIPAVWTLVLIIFGGKIAGILGILLAIPIAAIFVIIKNETIMPKLEKRKIKINSSSQADTGQTEETAEPEQKEE